MNLLTYYERKKEFYDPKNKKPLGFILNLGVIHPYTKYEEPPMKYH